MRVIGNTGYMTSLLGVEGGGGGRGAVAGVQMR